MSRGRFPKRQISSCCRVPSLLGFKHVGVEVRLMGDGKLAVKRGTFGEARRCACHSTCTCTWHGAAGQFPDRRLKGRCLPTKAGICIVSLKDAGCTVQHEKLKPRTSAYYWGPSQQYSS